MTGVRSPDWVKFPSIRTAEVVAVGWRESSTELGGLASILVAWQHDDALAYAGRIGTGLSAAERRRIPEKLHRLERKTAPLEVPREVSDGAHWVTPKLVGEAVYRALTGEGRLRHASWRGWRPDRSANEVLAPAELDRDLHQQKHPEYAERRARWSEAMSEIT